MLAYSEAARRRFTVEDVRAMVEAGILDEEEHLELLEGELVVVPPQGPEHSGTATLLERRLALVFGPQYQVRASKPLLAGEESLPEPDIGVFRADERAFMKRHPRGDEAVLVVEVARTSLKFDREKARIYAAAGVPVYWLVDVEGRRLFVHTEPSPKGYQVVTVYAEEKEVSPPGLDARWTVSSLLP